MTRATPIESLARYLADHRLTYASGSAGCSCNTWQSPDFQSPRVPHEMHVAAMVHEYFAGDQFECVDCHDTGTDIFLGLPCTQCEWRTP